MELIFQHLLSLIDDSRIKNIDVIRWGSPVISFGDFETAKVATLGLNPSNREFLSKDGAMLSEEHRRFETLDSLGINSWLEITEAGRSEALNKCKNYFDLNPYDAWFKSLEKIFLGSGVSYYGLFSNACHLDLVPFATKTKWGDLSARDKQVLLQVSSGLLADILVKSNIKLLVLNGMSVINIFCEYSDCTLEREQKNSWTLPRKNSPGVAGYAYLGRVKHINGKCLGREVKVVGYNHNIQSSFGVTTEVINSINHWFCDIYGDFRE